MAILLGLGSVLNAEVFELGSKEFCWRLGQLESPRETMRVNNWNQSRDQRGSEQECCGKQLGCHIFIVASTLPGAPQLTRFAAKG
jgi:hypothetical protein